MYSINKGINRLQIDIYNAQLDFMKISICFIINYLPTPNLNGAGVGLCAEA